jgi:hypothetical protein
VLNPFFVAGPILSILSSIICHFGRRKSRKFRQTKKILTKVLPSKEKKPPFFVGVRRPKKCRIGE